VEKSGEAKLITGELQPAPNKLEQAPRLASHRLSYKAWQEQNVAR